MAGHGSDGFGDLRNRALEACRYDWVFSLDSDERCTEEVRDEILALLAGQPAHDAYLVPRRSYMMGRWITGSGWYPNYRQPQLFRKGAMRYTLDPVHEGYELLTDKPLGKLRIGDVIRADEISQPGASVHAITPEDAPAVASTPICP